MVHCGVGKKNNSRDARPFYDITIKFHLRGTNLY